MLKTPNPTFSSGYQDNRFAKTSDPNEPVTSEDIMDVEQQSLAEELLEETWLEEKLVEKLLADRPLR
jgi:hypothetical protein